METRISNLYQRLVSELLETISRYEEAPGKDHPKAVQRVSDYRAVIELAKQK